MKLFFPKQNYNVLSPSSYTYISVRDWHISGIGLPILLRKYVDRSWEHLNRSQTHECGNWNWGCTFPEKEYIKWDYRCSVGAAQGHSTHKRHPKNHFELSSKYYAYWPFVTCCLPCWCRLSTLGGGPPCRGSLGGSRRPGGAPAPPPGWCSQGTPPTVAAAATPVNTSVADPWHFGVPLTNGSGSCYFRHWPWRCHQKTNF
jgi:hypothetical protein